jgi:hypothetical protein
MMKMETEVETTNSIGVVWRFADQVSLHLLKSVEPRHIAYLETANIFGGIELERIA